MTDTIQRARKIFARPFSHTVLVLYLDDGILEMHLKLGDNLSFQTLFSRCQSALQECSRMKAVYLSSSVRLSIP